VVLFGVCFQQRGEDAAIRGDGFQERILASFAVAAEHQVAESNQAAGFGGREEALGYGDGEFGQDATDFVGGDHRAARGKEFAGEIGGAEAAVRGVGMGVAEGIGIGSGGKGATASIGESKLASSVCGFGLFRSHAERIIYCGYGCLVTGRYLQFRTAGKNVRMAAEECRKGSRSKPKTQVPKIGTWATRRGRRNRFDRQVALV